MKNLIILGGSGIGMIAISIAKELGIYTIGGFLNDVLPIGAYIGKYEKYPIIGTTDDLEKYLRDDNNVFLLHTLACNMKKAYMTKSFH